MSRTISHLFPPTVIQTLQVQFDNILLIFMHIETLSSTTFHFPQTNFQRSFKKYSFWWYLFTRNKHAKKPELIKSFDNIHINTTVFTSLPVTTVVCFRGEVHITYRISNLIYEGLGQWGWISLELSRKTWTCHKQNCVAQIWTHVKLTEVTISTN